MTNENIEVLKLLTTSWPFAFMVAAFLLTGLAFYIVRWQRKVHEDDKAYRAAQAVTVRDR